MKKWKKRGIYAAVYIFACALTVWDVENKFWIAPLTVWVAGTYLLYKRLKPIIEEEITLLRQSDNNRDFICAFVSGAVVFALTIFALLSGFRGWFDFNIAESTSFFECMIEGLLVLFAIDVAFIAIYFVLLLVIGALLGSNEHSRFGATIAPLSAYFLLLCHCCGVVDVFKIMAYVSKAWLSIVR